MNLHFTLKYFKRIMKGNVVLRIWTPKSMLYYSKGAFIHFEIMFTVLVMIVFRNICALRIDIIPGYCTHPVYGGCCQTDFI